MGDNPANEFVSRPLVNQQIHFSCSAMSQLRDQNLPDETMRYLEMSVTQLSYRIVEKSLTVDQAWQTFYNMLK